MNKTIVLVLVIIIIAVGGYFLIINQNADTPQTDETAVSVDSRDYVGMTTFAAAAKAAADGTLFRVVEIDGEPQPTTRDFREGRINATVTDSVVTSFTIEGREPVSENQSVEAAAGSHTNPYFKENALQGDMIEPQNSTDESARTTPDEIIIGMTTAQAAAYAAEKGVYFRIGTVDGEPMPLTLDYRPGRITAEIVRDSVVSYTVE